MKRVFIAINLPDEIRKIFAKIQKKVSNANKDKKIIWVKPEIAHVNLHFIGDLSEEKIDLVSKALGQITDFYPAPELSLTGVGGFPSVEAPRVLFLGIKDLRQDNLVKLHQFINDELIKLKIETNTRAYMAHLTLGRVKVQRPMVILPDMDFEGVSWVADSVDFMESELTPQGPVYKVIKSFKLK